MNVIKQLDMMEIILGITLCMTLCSCGAAPALPAIDAGEGKNSIQVAGGGFWVQTYLGDRSGQNVVAFRILVVYPAIAGFGNIHTLSSIDGGQVIRVSTNSKEEVHDLISYQASKGILVIGGKEYKATLGEYFLINLSNYPAVQVLQSKTLKSDEESDANKILKNFQRLFPNEASIANLNLPQR